MKKLIVFLILLFALAPMANAELIANGATSVRIHFVMSDRTTGVRDTTITIANLEMYYTEDAAAESGDAFTGELAGDTTTWVDGECRNMGHGVYRTDWPNAAFDGGVGKKVHLTLVDGDAGAFTETIVVELSAPVDAVLVVGATPIPLGDIETAADNALVSVNLDHLMKTSTGVAADGDLSGHVVSGTVLSHIMSIGADVTTAFNATEDSLDALGTHGDAVTAAAIADAVCDEAVADHLTPGSVGWFLNYLQNLWFN